MFERWRAFELSGENFREIIESIGDALKKLGVSEREAETARQLTGSSAQNRLWCDCTR